MRAFIFLHILVLSALCEEISLLAHKDFPFTALSGTQIRQLFLHEIRQIHGHSIEIVQHRSRSQERELFARNFLLLSGEEEELHWRQILVSEGLRPPATKKDCRVIQKFLSKNQSGLGYCFSGETLIPEIKVIQVLP